MADPNNNVVQGMQLEGAKCKGRKSWKLLRNVVIASALFKNQEAAVVSDVEKLLEDIRNSPKKAALERRMTLQEQSITDYKAAEKLFFHISRSRAEDIIEIDRLIDNDPRKFSRESTDPESFVNKANVSGIRPIYEACKNGYVDTVLLLLDRGSNPHLLSLVDGKCKENALDVASRWSHVNVVKALLKSSLWSGREINSAAKQTRNAAIREMLKLNEPKSSKSCFCRKKS